MYAFFHSHYKYYFLWQEDIVTLEATLVVKEKGILNYIYKYLLINILCNICLNIEEVLCIIERSIMESVNSFLLKYRELENKLGKINKKFLF